MSNPTSTIPKTKAGLKKVLSDPIDLHRRYILLLLSFNGTKSTDTELDILACYSYFGEVSAKVKKLLAAKHKTSVNSICNVITRLRKRGLVKGREIHPKLKAPAVKDGSSLTLLIQLTYQKPNLKG